MQSHSTVHWTGRFSCLIPAVCILCYRCRSLQSCRLYWRECVDHLREYQDHHSWQLQKWMMQYYRINTFLMEGSTIVLTGTCRITFEHVINMFDTSTKGIKTHGYIEVSSHSTVHWTGRFSCLIPAVCILCYRCRSLQSCRLYWSQCVDHLREYQGHHSWQLYKIDKVLGITFRKWMNKIKEEHIFRVKKTRGTLMGHPKLKLLASNGAHIMPFSITLNPRMTPGYTTWR